VLFRKLQKFPVVLLDLKSQILIHKKAHHVTLTMTLVLTVCEMKVKTLSRFMQPANFAFQKLKQFQFLFLFTFFNSVLLKRQTFMNFRLTASQQLDREDCRSRKSSSSIIIISNRKN
jgi:hypothetical protein